MKQQLVTVVACVLSFFAATLVMAEENGDAAMQAAVAQLRSAVGDWDVVTDFLNEDGSVARSVQGTYRFTWVIEDKLVSGVSEMPELDMRSAILFYIDENDREIEMVSVGQDGRLWIMTGPVGSETRYTQEFASAGGNKAQLRFTRYNVADDSFESRMEYTNDGGASWLPGNHQVFQRRGTNTQ